MTDKITQRENTNRKKQESVESFLSWLGQERNLKLWEKSVCFLLHSGKHNFTRLLWPKPNPGSVWEAVFSSVSSPKFRFEIFGILKSIWTLPCACVPSICERVTPRLSHANSAVVLSAVKVLMKFLELLPKDSDYYNMLLKKLAPPLVTLLSGEPEVQYVALRNINLIVQKR